MPYLQITINHINTSLQEGDDIYYVSSQLLGGFDVGDYSNIIKFGTVSSIDFATLTIIVLWDGISTIPIDTDFILFSKSKNINTPSLVGYFAEAEFKNNSSKKIELFAVGAEVFESSK